MTESQRLLTINNGFNFRDLGGYPTTDGHVTKWQRLLRTGALAQLDDQDLAVLARIPVTIDVDLRSPAEVKKAPDRIPAGAKYYHLPVLADDATAASHSDEEIAAVMQEPGNGYRHMIDVYRQMITVASAKAAFQKLFDLLLANQHGALLFHCTAGKDRTGIATYLILSALGVKEEVIIEDYLLTNDVTKDFRDQWLQKMRDQGASEALIANRAALASVSADYLNAAVKEIKTKYGDVMHYLTNYLEISPTQIKQLRKLYLD